MSEEPIPAERVLLAEIPEKGTTARERPAPEPERAAPARGRSAVVPQAETDDTVPARAEPPKADPRLEREMSALVEAKHALASDPARALRLARDGEREFAGGVFGEERRHVLLLALIALGRLDEAHAVAAPYLASHPGSPFARRVRRALDAADARRASH